tara:strand:- start:10008 stop:10178 length:171 start_codon:yes stop_codon:yes gene_type:complete
MENYNDAPVAVLELHLLNKIDQLNNALHDKKAEITALREQIEHLTKTNQMEGTCTK